MSNRLDASIVCLLIMLCLSNMKCTVNTETTTKETDNFAYQKEIVNPHNFTYIFNPEYKICGKDEKLFLLIYVILLIFILFLIYKKC